MSLPKVQLSGENGNIFNLTAVARRALIDHYGRIEGKKISDKMLAEIMKSDSYESALSIISEYVDIY